MTDIIDKHLKIEKIEIFVFDRWTLESKCDFKIPWLVFTENDQEEEAKHAMNWKQLQMKISNSNFMVIFENPWKSQKTCEVSTICDKARTTNRSCGYSYVGSNKKSIKSLRWG